MKKLLAVLALLSIIVPGTAAFADQDPLYPFKVTIAGKEAVKENPTAAFAVINEAVPADSEIQVAADGQVIINAVQCDAQGNPVPGALMSVIMFQAPKGSLAKTMDGKKLQSGKYLMNVVAGGTTARVVFDVK